MSALDTVPEVRALSKLHTVTQLQGRVTRQNVYDACQGQRYDVLHIAGHSDEDHIWLSDGDSLKDEDLLRLMSMAGFRLLFFNSCRSGRLAVYATNHGAPHAIATMRLLPDADAWAAAYAFYDHCHAQKVRLGSAAQIDFFSAYQAAFNGDGTYAFLSNPQRQAELAGLLAEMHTWRQEQTTEAHAWRKSQRRISYFLALQAGAGWAVLVFLAWLLWSMSLELAAHIGGYPLNW